MKPSLCGLPALREQEGASHAARHAVVPAGDSGVDEMRTGHRHGWNSWSDR